MGGVKMKNHHQLLLLLWWVVLMMSSTLSSTRSQPVLTNNVDWEKDCTKPCECRWSKGLKVGECRPNVTKIPETLSSKIQSLDLSSNHIVAIEGDDFFKVKLFDLQQIDLRKNSVRHIRLLAFNGLKILTVIDLSENDLENIDPMVFEPLPNLKDLRMKGNPLQRFTSPEFPTLPNLENIDLSSCRLTTLPPTLFNNLKKLSRLELSGNLFQQLSADVFRPVAKLNSLNLAQNPFLCDCHLRALHTFVTHRQFSPRTTCDVQLSSDPTRGKQFSELTTNNFFCPPEITLYRTHGPQLSPEDSNERNVATGDDLTFDCQVEGDPMPELLWLRNDKLLFNTSTDFRNDKYTLSTLDTSKFKLSNLTIKNLDKEDSGIYFCFASTNIDLTVKKGTELNVDPSVLVGGVGGRNKSRTWVWILLGILGFLILVAFIVLLVFCVIRHRRRVRKAKRVADINSGDGVEKKLYENRTIKREISSTAPLLEKSANNQVLDSNNLKLSKEEEAMRRDYVDSRNQPLQPLTPLAVTPILGGHYPHPSVPSTPTFIHTHQFGPGQGQLYPPGRGWATYDPRRNQNDPVALNFRQPIPYGRLYSPFSGSVASFTSEPPRQGQFFGDGRKGMPGYVTLPRRHRNPSWSGTGQGGGQPRTPVPPSPTGSLPLVPNLRTRYYGHMGPRYDTVGPRTTADGGSNVSLNKLGVGGGGSGARSLQRNPGYITPSTPVSAKNPLNRSLTGPPTTPSSSGRIPKTHNTLGHHHLNPLPSINHFNFDPIEENDGPVTPTTSKIVPDWPFPTNPSQLSNYSTVIDSQPDNLSREASPLPPHPPPPLEEGQSKEPPLPPAKPKRKSENLEEELDESGTATIFTNPSLHGTEV